MIGGLWYSCAALGRESARVCLLFTWLSNHILATEIEHATTTEKSSRRTEPLTSPRGNAPPTHDFSWFLMLRAPLDSLHITDTYR